MKMNMTKSEINKKYNKKMKQKKIDSNFILEEDEEYKCIIGNEKYYITNKGRLFSTITCSFLKPSMTKQGYLSVCLSNRKHHLIHRLIAIHFIENLNPDKELIDHIDRNKLNNNIQNLRWVDYKENANNKYRKGCIYKTNDIVKGILYEGWRVYWYDENNKKKSKRFKIYDDALKNYKLKQNDEVLKLKTFVKMFSG